MTHRTKQFNSSSRYNAQNRCIQLSLFGRVKAKFSPLAALSLTPAGGSCQCDPGDSSSPIVPPVFDSGPLTFQPVFPSRTSVA